MRITNLIVVMLFAVGLCFAAVPADSVAKTEKKETTAVKKKATSKTKTTAKKTTKKATDKAKAKTAKAKTKKDKAAKKTSTAKKAVSLKAKSVSINSANKALLVQLPGVGDATADAIIKHRKANGKFKSIGDLKNVKGIGDKKLIAMKKYLKL